MKYTQEKLSSLEKTVGSRGQQLTDGIQKMEELRQVAPFVYSNGKLDKLHDLLRRELGFNRAFMDEIRQQKQQIEHQPS